MASFPLHSPIRRKPVPRPTEIKSSPSFDNIPLVDLNSEETCFEGGHDDAVQALVQEHEDNDPNCLHPRLLRTRSKRFLLAAGDISLLIFPLLFMVLAVSAYVLDSKLESEYGRAMMKLSNFGPTIFPIAFTTIVGRLMKSMAYYLAERGTSLRMIEQLVQSQSLASSVEAAVSLRKLTTGGFFIMAVWVLSPLGGQSSLRVLRIRADIREEGRLIYHLMINSCHYIGGLEAAVSPIFMASVIASNSTKDSPVDTWDNPKVPIQRLTQIDSQESYPWIPVVANSSMDYLSLIGLRLWNIPKVGRTEFFMESSSLTPNCSKQPSLTKEEWVEAQLPNYTFDSFVSRDDYNTSTGYLYNRKKYINLQFAIQSPQEGTEGYLYNCTLRSTSLELHMLCNGGACKVNRTRSISSQRRPDWKVPWTEGGETGITVQTLQRTLDLIKDAASPSKGNDGYNTPIEAFLQGNSPFYRAYGISFEDVPDADFSVRFGQLLNSIYLSTELYGDIAGSVREPAPPYLEAFGGSNGKYSNSTAMVFLEQTVYEAVPIWIAFLTVACIFLLICCCVTFYIHQWVLVPDVFGFVATSASESPSFARYTVGSYMDGWERARVLGDVNVRFEDAAPHETHGKLRLVASDLAAERTNLKVRKQVFSKRMFG